MNRQTKEGRWVSRKWRDWTTTRRMRELEGQVLHQGRIIQQMQQFQAQQAEATNKLSARVQATCQRIEQIEEAVVTKLDIDLPADEVNAEDETEE